MMTDDCEAVRKNLPSSTLEALEQEIAEVLSTCNDFVDRDTKLRLKQLNNGKIFDYDTNSNIEKLAHDMTLILESFKVYLTNTQSQEDTRLKKKIREIHDEKLREKKKLEQAKEDKDKLKEEARDKSTKTETGKEVNDDTKKAQNPRSSSVEKKPVVADKKFKDPKNFIEVYTEPVSQPKKPTQVPSKNPSSSEKPEVKAVPEKKPVNIKTLERSNTTVGISQAGNKKIDFDVHKSRSSMHKTDRSRSRGKLATKNKSRESTPNRHSDKNRPQNIGSRTSNRLGSSKRRRSHARSKSKDSQTSLSSRTPTTTSLSKTTTSPRTITTTSKSKLAPTPVPTSAPTPAPATPPTKTPSIPTRTSSTAKVEPTSKIIPVISPLYPPKIPTIENTIRKSLNLPLSKRPYSAVKLQKSSSSRSNSEGPNEWGRRSTASVSSRLGSARTSSVKFRHPGSEKPSSCVVSANTPHPAYNFPKTSSFSVAAGSNASFHRRRSSASVPREVYNPLGLLKEEVDEAVANRKTFTVRGCFPVIRQSLIRRGWVEKVHASYRHGEMKKYLSLTTQELLDLVKKPETTRIANVALKGKLLANQQVDLFYGYNYDGYSDCSDRFKLTLINKIRWKNVPYTSKHGLCEASRQAFWFNLPGVSNLNVPRSYRLAKEGDAEEFVKDFNITAAMSLLKWVKTRFEVQRSRLMTANGRIPLRMFDFAINECYKFLKRARHEDIDQEIKEALSHEWNEFLEYFYKIVHVGCVFKLENHVTEVDMLRRANYILSKLREYWQYLNMDGELNIWILKPTNSCRGIGIHMCRTLKYVLDTVRANPNRRYIIQKYIERPLLIFNTKFDIRQWFLISSTVPLTIWMYKICYLRFSSQTYNLKKLHESIHLTNNSVQCKYKNVNHDPHLPTYCMWDSNEFQTYLIGKNQPFVWKDKIYPGMRECITAAVLMHQENMEKRRNSFEIYGADFILTEDYKPWLLEINANPALSASTPITARLCPKVMEDIIKVIVDWDRNKNSNTGSFELIYKGTLNKKETQCREERSLVVDGKPLSPDYFYKSKWSPKERDTSETDWGLNKKIKNLSRNPDTTDFGLVSVTGMKQTLQSLLELLKKEKERRKDQKRRSVMESPPFPSPIGVDTWLEKRKNQLPQPVP